MRNESSEQFSSEFGVVNSREIFFDAELLFVGGIFEDLCR